MNIIPGIIVGFLLSIPCAIGVTLYNLTISNTVGTHRDDSALFIDDDDPFTFHVNKDVRN